MSEQREKELQGRLKKALRLARYWKGQSMRELMRCGALRICTEHHEPVKSWDPFRTPPARTFEREEALRRRVQP